MSAPVTGQVFLAPGLKTGPDPESLQQLQGLSDTRLRLKTHKKPLKHALSCTKAFAAIEHNSEMTDQLPCPS